MLRLNNPSCITAGARNTSGKTHYTRILDLLRGSKISLAECVGEHGNTVLIHTLSSGFPLSFGNRTLLPAALQRSRAG
jgi:hypothetical protein